MSGTDSVQNAKLTMGRYSCINYACTCTFLYMLLMPLLDEIFVVIYWQRGDAYVYTCNMSPFCIQYVTDDLYTMSCALKEVLWIYGAHKTITIPVVIKIYAYEIQSAL